MKIAASLSIGVAMAGIAFAQQQRDFPASPTRHASAPLTLAAPRLPQFISQIAEQPRAASHQRLPRSAEMGESFRYLGLATHPQSAFSVGFPGPHSVHSPEHQKKSAEATERMSKATQLLKSDSKDERTEAKKDLAAALTDLFDVMTESREQQIDELERRLQKMREQLEERNDRKQEIVDLRLQTIVNEANGLTF